MPAPVRGLSLPLRLHTKPGGFAWSTGDAKIRENLIHILLSAPGERPMRRAFGGGVQALVHEPEGAVLYGLLRHQIGAAIATLEPRVVVRRIEVAPDPDASVGGAVLIMLEYAVRGTAEVSQIFLPISPGAVP